MQRVFRPLSIIALSAFAISQAIAGTLPSRQAPDHYKSYDDASGGRIVVGSPGQYSTPKEAFNAGRGQFRGYFDPTPRVLKAIQNRQGTVAILAFRASLQGDRVVGLVVVKCLQSGNSRLDITYGEPKTFLPHVKDLMTRMNRLDAEATGSLKPSTSGGHAPAPSSPAGLDLTKYAAASKKVALTSSTSSDGTLTIGLADGFQPAQFGTSECLIKSDDGALMRYDFIMNALDPRSSLGRSLGHAPAGGAYAMYDPDPIIAWKNINAAAARATARPDMDIQVATSAPIDSGGVKAKGSMGSFTLDDKQYVYSNLVAVTAPNQMGLWNITITILAAPADNVASDAPKLVAMLHSARLNKAAIARANQLGFEQLAINQRALNAQSAAMSRSMGSFGSSAADTYMGEAADMTDSTDRSTAGFCNILRNQEVITDSEGYHDTVSYGLGDLLTNADPNEFSEVPLSDYQSGVDYDQ